MKHNGVVSHSPPHGFEFKVVILFDWLVPKARKPSLFNG